MQLVWFRNDLRLNANTPLSQALQTGEKTIALYMLCQAQWDRHDVAPIRRWYVLKSLLELGKSLAKRGVSLYILDVGSFDDVAEQLDKFVVQQCITQLYCNRDYPLNEIRRDRAVAQRLADRGVTIYGYDDAMLVPPRALRTGKGTPYCVYTPYRKRWQEWLDLRNSHTTARPNWPNQHATFVGEAIAKTALEQLHVQPALTNLWQAGEKAALAQLSFFIDNRLCDYKAQRDFPDSDATSLLSTAFSVGTLSPHQAFSAARHQLADVACREGATCWISELAWRDFYRQIMYHYPKLATGKPFRPETDLLPWKHSTAAFNAWCGGRTGYPLVDAAMRQLVKTGWMHNRLRMVTAMFLTKHLFIDWRAGERFFMQHLIDGDFAANNGGWQWSASTGTDAVPYFRVFSPIRQSQRFDPNGDFIKRFVPELSALDNKSIHEPWKSPLLAPDYPPPIVTHSGVKKEVEAAFRAAKSTWDHQQHLR